MATQHLVYKAPDNQIIGVFDTTAKANTFAATGSGWAVTSVEDQPDVDVGWYVTSAVSPGAVSKDPPSTVVSSAQKIDWRSHISAAFLTYIRTLPKWRSDMEISTHIQAALKAAIRYGFHQAAMAAQVAATSNPLFGSLTDAQRDTLIAHVIDVLSRQAATILSEFVGNATDRDNWSGVAVIANTTIRSDLATSTGAVRTRDRSFTAMAGNGSTIPDKFTPENPALT